MALADWQRVNWLWPDPRSRACDNWAMPRRASTATDDVLTTSAAAHALEGESWFVYLFALGDCSAFKVGFSCNPLQRITTFSRRYFERFDLSQSLIIDLHTCEQARATEAAVKRALDSVRAQPPAWVPLEAGGHTEWFSAVNFVDAETLVRAEELAIASSAFDFLRPTLEGMRNAFERWAFIEAQRLCEERSAMQRGYAVRGRSVALRDWLDAYAHFDVPLFEEDAAAGEFVRRSARAKQFPLS